MQRKLFFCEDWISTICFGHECPLDLKTANVVVPRLTMVKCRTVICIMFCMGHDLLIKGRVMNRLIMHTITGHLLTIRFLLLIAVHN